MGVPSPVERASTLTTVLGAVAGYVDTFGFVSLHGLFTAHVTGNLVVAAADVTHHGGEGSLARLLLLPLFVAAVVATALVAQRLRDRGDPWLLPGLLLIEALGLLLFGALGLVFGAELHQGLERPAVLLVAGAGVAAMGVQNALMREALGALVPTTVMTGNVTQLTLELTHLWMTRAAPPGSDQERARPAARAKARSLALSLLGFFSGAALGAWAFVALGFAGLFPPALAIAALALSSRPPSAGSAP